MVRVSGLVKEYTGAGAVRPLRLFDGLSFEVQRGEMLAIVGASGSGKSTLLHMLGALDHVTAGDLMVDGTSLASLGVRAQADFRNRTIGYVWQAHHLLPEFTAAENVAMPLLARGTSAGPAHKEAMDWLGRVGLASRVENRAGELSGGEQQRVALARALVTGPRLLLADEPTGNLDSVTGEAVFSLLEQLHQDHGMTTVLVTHNPGFAQRCHRTLVLQNGQLTPPPA